MGGIMFGQPVTAGQISEVIDLMRNIGVDLQRFEVKACRTQLTKDIARTLSAFSNGSGGLVICGLSERDGFTAVAGFDAKAIQDALARVCSEQLSPPVRPEIQVLPFEGSLLVVASVPEMRPMDKPCYVRASNRYDGSYIRTGDGDRRLPAYEVDRLVDEHRQPQYDAAIVEEALPGDLNEELVQGLLRRERRIHARNFALLPDEDALIKLGVLRIDNAGILRPTIAGLVSLGDYPQQFFPRLNISFACYPGTSKSDVSDAGKRLLDSVTLVGPIPHIVEDAIAAVARNTRSGALIEGAFRREVPDYPEVALREAIVNALMHRDYSSQSLGTPVQLDLYVDRLEIINPGGLFGNVTVSDLGRTGISSTRNQHLANLLESTPYTDGTFVAENRGTGYRTIEVELANALMPAPIPRDTIGAFFLTFPRRRTTASERTLPVRDQMRAAIRSILEEHGSVTTTEVIRQTGRSRATAMKYIRQMIDEGILEPMEPVGSTKQRYRLSTT